MKKKLVSLLLVAVLLLTTVMAAACSQKTGTDTTAAGADTTAVDTTAGADTTAAAQEDLTVVTILCPSNNTQVQTPLRYSENPRWESIPVVQTFYKMLEEVGVRLEYEVIDNEQYNEAVKTRLMTGIDLPDIIANPGMSDVEAINAGEAGVIADVSALIDEYDADGSIKQYWNEKVGATIAGITTEDGNIWWMPYTYHREVLNDDGTPAALTKNGVAYHVSIREDWLNALGQERKMFYTPEEVLDILTAFYENDANGNGVKDEVIGNFSTSFYTGFESAFDMVYGLIGIRNDGKGVQCNLYNENFEEYVGFMQELYNRGLIDTTVLNGTDVNSANRGSTYASYAGQSWAEAAITGYEDTAIYTPIIIDDDEGENGYSLYMVDANMMVLGKWFVNANSENLEAVIKVFDVLYTDESSFLSVWGEEGLTYDVDENGNKIRRTGGDPSDPTYCTTFCSVLNNALPNVYDITDNRVTFAATQAKPEKYQGKFDMIMYTFDNHENCTFQDGVAPYAMLTNSEMETVEALQTTLNTYIEEMMLKLITGEYSLDDYPTYLAELESMGLKDYIAVFEARHQRWVDYANENGIETLYN